MRGQALSSSKAARERDERKFPALTGSGADRAGERYPGAFLRRPVCGLTPLGGMPYSYNIGIDQMKV
jgi:hypothetical protein